jgi:hypothetical protein
VRGTSGGAANLCRVTRQARRARTERLLAAKLEEVSRALEAGRPARADAMVLIEHTSAATARAVSLRLLSETEAVAIWAEASTRHPAFDAAARRAGCAPALYAS